MLFKGSNNLVQIYRSFAITGNYGRQGFSKYGISYYTFSTADVKIHTSNRQIWYWHPNSEAGNDEIQNVQRESKHGFLFCGNYRHGMCFQASSVFILSILFLFPQRTHYFWRVFRFLFMEHKQDYSVTSVKDVKVCF
jgi:hypothetical protein